jgi:flagellar FliL protein
MFFGDGGTIHFKMKTPRFSHIVSTIIVIFTIILVVGTAISFFSHRAKPGSLLRRSEPIPAETPTSGEEARAYFSLGQIRIAAAAGGEAKPGTVIVLVSPWFTYPGDDQAFYEELSQKSRKIKGIVTGYFSSQGAKDLLNKGEGTVKEELRGLINGELLLGQIGELYFDDYLFFD